MKTKFKSFLIEGSEEIHQTMYPTLYADDVQDLTKYLEENCASAWKAFQKYRGARSIYRGVTDDFGEVVLGEYGKGSRFAKNTSDLYRMLIDTSPGFSEYPKRGKSLIASTDQEYANGYGETYLVLPFDGAPIGVCQYEDMFDTDVPVFGSSMPISSFSMQLCTAIEIHKSVRLTLDELKQKIDQIGVDKVIKRLTGNWKSESAREAYGINNGADFINAIHSHTINPKAMSTTLTTSNAIFNNASFFGTNSREVWFSGKCVMIHSDVVSRLHLHHVK